MDINRDGIPVRHWIYPGNRIDVTTVEEVTRDLRGRRPRRFLFVGDRGMVSQANLDFLESRRLGYLLGRRLRTDPALEAPAQISSICNFAYLRQALIWQRERRPRRQTSVASVPPIKPERRSAAWSFRVEQGG